MNELDNKVGFIIPTWAVGYIADNPIELIPGKLLPDTERIIKNFIDSVASRHGEGKWVIAEHVGMMPHNAIQGPLIEHQNCYLMYYIPTQHIPRQRIRTTETLSQYEEILPGMKALKADKANADERVEIELIDIDEVRMESSDIFVNLHREVYRLRRIEHAFHVLVATITLPQNRDYMPDMLVDMAENLRKS
jgi:hypothetical protein